MNSSTAIKIMLSIVVVVTLFHTCILLKVIPYEITWGGRLKNDSEMYMFETISILINIFLGLTLLIKGKFLKELISLRIVNVILWVFFVLFSLNTVGNIFAETNFEKLFSILTLSSSVLIWIILRAKNQEQKSKIVR